MSPEEVPEKRLLLVGISMSVIELVLLKNFILCGFPVSTLYYKRTFLFPLSADAVAGLFCLFVSVFHLVLRLYSGLAAVG